MQHHLLLVDDHEEILDFLKDELQDKYLLHLVTDGKAALNLLRREQVDLVISDVMMPEIDGFELCRLIKTNIELNHIPVILLTAKNTLQSKIEGLELGADAYIEKPFSPAHLQAQIASLLANRQRFREHFITSSESIVATNPDQQLMEEINQLILQHIDNTELDVEKLAALMNISRPTLYRKIKTISQLSPHDLINITRLKKAAGLLTTGLYRIAEIADMVGYSSQTNFGRNFLKQFGMTPSEYAQQTRKTSA